ncbi:hypothetical protein IMZ48_45410 [Candidatus Bathyarchaeota archaeon]|nr:hypothetical protein [Candidatus Bathyarchaeota archaeon]
MSPLTAAVSRAFGSRKDPALAYGFRCLLPELRWATSRAGTRCLEETRVGFDQEDTPAKREKG